MPDLVALSTRIIDEGLKPHEAVNRITQELSELGHGLAIIESFSHVIIVDTAEGLALFDTSSPMTGPLVLDSMRRWSSKPTHSILYTHGHVDHVGGSGAFIEDAKSRGDARPRVVGHERVRARLDRYDLTDGYNSIINSRQFGGVRAGGMSIGGVERFLPSNTAPPDLSFREELTLTIGGVQLELQHSKGETDDHLWAWIPEKKTICAGDFFIWNFPNAGNPQKVQRYPLEWARALRKMATKGAELFVPAHGLPIGGRKRIANVLDEVASALEHVVDATLEMMNAGERLDAILQAVKVAPDVLAKPYLRPLYDEPEFVVRNVWRLYGGWYDGNPAHLKPAPAAQVARELAGLSGGVARLVTRAQELAAAGDLRLACELIEFAAQAAPDDRNVHSVRAEIYGSRRKDERSLMAKGIYSAAAHESTDAAAVRFPPQHGQVDYAAS